MRLLVSVGLKALLPLRQQQAQSEDGVGGLYTACTLLLLMMVGNENVSIGM